MIKIILTSPYSLDIVIICGNDELKSLFILNRQYSNKENGIRTMFSIKKLEIFIEEFEDLIDIDIKARYSDYTRSDSDWSYISDEESDTTENNLDRIIPVRFYNNNIEHELSDTESE